MENIGFAKADTSWGKPEQNIEFDPTVYQYYPDSCAFQSQAMVLHEFGIDVTQQQLMEIAREQGWYVDGNGTPIEKVGKLLEYFNVDSNFTEGNNIFNLANELAQGHQIIVAVDSGELWNPGLSERLEDIFWGGRPDHALVVVGIDTSDANDVKVIVTDPGNGNNQMAYSEKQFMDAWKDSDCFMVSTKESPESFTEHFHDHNMDSFADISYSTIQSLASEDINIESDHYADFFHKFMENPDNLPVLLEEYQDSVFAEDTDTNNDTDDNDIDDVGDNDDVDIM